MIPAAFDIEQLSAALTGRASPVFDQAWDRLQIELEQAVTGRRILVSGGAGFIAGQTLRLLAPLRPALIVIADSDENSLAELVRDLRAAGDVSDETRIEPRLIDVTGPLVPRLVGDDGPFDAALLFAAAKHVRSERDPVSALHLLNVNVLGTHAVARAVMDSNPQCRLFVVSTDKAADPSSLMGASKRLMEGLVFADFPGATSARFANVAFSSGSLLESWLIRLGRSQVLAVPQETARYFVSPREAGQLCAAAALAPAGSIVAPSPGVVQSIDLVTGLERVLGALGMELVTGTDASEAYKASRPNQRFALVTPRDTAGEKPSEVFVGRGESSSPWLPSLDLVHAPPLDGARNFASWLEDSFRMVSGPDLYAILSRVHEALPNFDHVGSTLRLDDRI